MAKPIKIEILGDTSQFDKAIGGVSRSLGGIGNTMKKAGIGVAAGLGVVGVAAGAIAADAVNSLIRIEKINAQTDAVIKSMGDVAGITSQQIQDLTGSIESMTGVEAESIQEGANLLLTFGNIKNAAGEGNDIFTQTTKLMTDMSVAMGTDASSSAIQLGKALNDPMKGITALTRVGVSFTEQQKEQIKALTESGDVLGAQKIILGELENQFGGSAEAFGETTAGKIERVKHAFGTLTESLASGLLPIVESVTTWVMDRALPTMQRWGDWVGENLIPTIKELSDKYIKPLVDKVLPKVQEWFNKITKNGEDMTPVIAAVAAVIGLATVALGAFVVSMMAAAAPVVAVVAAVAALAAGVAYAWNNWDWFRQGVQAVVNWFMNDALPPLKQFATSLVELFRSAFEAVRAVIDTAIKIVKKVWDGWGSDLVGGIKRTFSAIMDVLKGAVQVLTGIFDLIKAILTGKWGEAWEAVKKILTGALTAIWGSLRAVGNQITNILSGIRTILAGIFTTAWNAAKTAVTDGITNVYNAFAGLPTKLYNLGLSFLNVGKNLGSNILSGLKNALGSAVSFASDLGEKMKNAVKGALNWMIDKINAIDIHIGWPINKTIGFPDIPKVRAMGGPAEGLVRVGERGVEDVWLPKGSEVRSALESNSGGQTVNVSVQSNADPMQIAREVAWALRTTGR